jgi:hypothetical protein
METLKSRFNNLKYEHFKIEFKGLLFEVKLIDNEAVFPNSKDNKQVEQFKVSVTNKDKKISFNFYNSIMEKGISDYLNSLGYVAYNNKQFKSFVSSKFSWGGYDDVKNRNDLIRKRIYHLFYGIVNSMAMDIEEDLSSFSWFCSNFGYDKDSRTSERIFKSCQEQQEKDLSLNIDEKTRKYLREEANQETNKFSKDIKEAIERAKEI